MRGQRLTQVQRGSDVGGRRRRAFVAVALSVAAVVWIVGGGNAHGETNIEQYSVELAPATEAWFRTTPPAPEEVAEVVCALPTGCAQKPAVADAKPYPDGTLHVGVAGGMEESRTYISFELTDVPDEATLTGGALVLPIAGTTAGSASPEAARLLACLVVEPVSEVRGAIEDPPAADCGISAPVVLEEAAGERVFTVDLAGFALDWLPGGDATLAIVPSSDSLGGGEAWHVAFHAKDSQADTPVPISATFTFDLAVEEDEGDENAVDEGDDGDDIEDDDVDAVFDESDDTFSDLASDTGAGDAVDLADDGGFDNAASTRTVFDEFAYPGVFLIPLALVAAWLFFGRQFAMPVPVRAVDVRR